MKILLLLIPLVLTPYGDTTAQNRPDFKQNNGKNPDVGNEVIRRRKGG